MHHGLHEATWNHFSLAAPGEPGTNLHILERAAQVQLLAREYGELALVPERHRAHAGDSHKEQSFAALKRWLDRIEPDYRE